MDNTTTLKEYCPVRKKTIRSIQFSFRERHCRKARRVEKIMKSIVRKVPKSKKSALAVDREFSASRAKESSHAFGSCLCFQLLVLVPHPVAPSTSQYRWRSSRLEPAERCQLLYPTANAPTFIPGWRRPEHPRTWIWTDDAREPTSNEGTMLPLLPSHP
jgi:hypothetical protein